MLCVCLWLPAAGPSSPLSYQAQFALHPPESHPSTHLGLVSPARPPPAPTISRMWRWMPPEVKCNYVDVYGDGYVCIYKIYLSIQVGCIPRPPAGPPSRSYSRPDPRGPHQKERSLVLCSPDPQLALQETRGPDLQRGAGTCFPVRRSALEFVVGRRRKRERERERETERERERHTVRGFR